MSFVLYNTDDKLVRGFCHESEAPEMDGCEAAEIDEVLAVWPVSDNPSAKTYFIEGELVSVDDRTLEDIKHSKNSEINAARLVANRTHFMFSGKQIACDELSRSDIDAITSEVSLTQQLPAAIAYLGGWKAMDNTYVAIPDVATWILFVKAMVNQGSSNFAKAQALKAQLLSAETAEQVASIKWDN